MKFKKIFKFIGRFFSLLLVTVIILVFTLFLTINSFINGPSNSAKELFVTTILETGKLKFLASWFLSKKEIEEIVNKNSLKNMNNEMDDGLITISKKSNTKENITFEKISGKTFSATLMIVSDPSTISLATTYPWGKYGKELDVLVKENNAIAGVNGGLYAQGENVGATPIGVAVSNGEIQYNNKCGRAGLHLIGFDNNNLLKIVDTSNMSDENINNYIKENKIRDAISFQEEAKDSNNHFVKLIINGETRKLNGKGSGANPRTVIGQKEDGTVLILVTDGRGANGHLGATAQDLINIMEEYGAINAANIDGGSSSTLYYKDHYIQTSTTLYFSNTSWKLPTAFIIKNKE